MQYCVLYCGGGVRIPVAGDFLFSKHIRTAAWGPSSIHVNGFRGSLRGVKWPERDVDHLPPIVAETENRSVSSWHVGILVHFWAGEGVFSLLPQRPPLLWGRPNPLCNGHKKIVPRGQSGMDVKLITTFTADVKNE